MPNTFLTDPESEPWIRGGAPVYREMMRAARHGIVLCDGNTYAVLEANPFALELLGMTREQAEGRILFDLPLLRDLPDLRRALQGSPAEAFACEEICMANSSGRRVFVDVRISSYLVSTTRIAECDLFPATARVRRRARESRRQSMAALAGMAGKIAAELNAQLPSIGRSHDFGVFASAALEEVQRSRERLAALARGLLAFAGCQALELCPLDVNALVTEVVDRLWGTPGDAVQVTRRLAPGLSPARADAARLREAISTLAVWARQRVAAGGRLTVATQAAAATDPCLRAIGAAPGPYVRVSVGDSGAPLDDSAWRRLFEPFYGFAGDAGDLALASVYGMVKQSGGYLAAAGDDAGMTIDIYLPVAETTVAPPPPRAAPGSGACIVLLEQEEGARRLMRNLLVRKGYEVVEAWGEEELRQILLDRGPQVGLLVAHRAAAALARSGVPPSGNPKVLYLAEAGEDNQNPGGPLPAGALVLEKPFRLDALLAKVRAALDDQASGRK